MTPSLRVLSLGAGVQSTTLALMAAAGEFPERLDAAIFADTQWEPAEVYQHLDWLTPLLPFPVHRVTAGNLREAVLTRRNTNGGVYAAVPWHTRNADGTDGMGRRQCTHEYKLRPIMWALRDLLGVSRTAFIRPGTIEQWVGISTDEALRMKDARQRYIATRWPLIERRMSRADCVRWLDAHGYPTPPKSACIGCPFHDQATWQQMRDTNPVAFAEAEAIDAALRADTTRTVVEFMHPARLPLRAAVEAYAREQRQQPNLFDHECEGMCGV